LAQICVNSRLIAIAAQDATVMTVRGKGTAFQATFVKGVVKYHVRLPVTGVPPRAQAVMENRMNQMITVK